MNSSDADLAASWNQITAQMNRYFSIFVFLFGIVGNVLNILVLSRKAFRTNPCAVLFMVSSIANFICILSGLTSRMLSGWAADLTNTDRFLCKLRAFILNVARPVASWLILLAAIDRWLLSSPYMHRRQMSSLRNAYRGMIIITILSILLFSHIIYCYEPNFVDAPLKCYGITMTCRYVTDLSFTFITILCPLLLMFVFGLMTITNIRQSRGRTRPGTMSVITGTYDANVAPRAYRKKRDYHLLVMLLVQILLLVVLGLPLGIQKVYAAITINRAVSEVQVAIDNFVYAFALLLNFLANGVPFYIYTMVGGKVFRRALSKMFAPGRLRFAH